MFEKFCIMVIEELGPTGLLVVGLYLVLGKSIKKIAEHIEVINHEGQKCNKLLEKLIEIWNGKN